MAVVPEPYAPAAAEIGISEDELLAHLDGELELDDAVDLAVRRTRRFARRQRVWFRRDPRIRWLTSDTDPMTLLDHSIRNRQLKEIA